MSRRKLVRPIDAFGPLRLLAVLVAGLALAVGGLACTDRQEMQDEMPTESQQQEVQEVDLADLADSPGEYRNQRVRGESRVQRVLSDHAFMIGETDDSEGFLTTIVRPEQAAVDLQEGQRVRLEGRVVDRSQVIAQVGPDLPEEAVSQLDNQELTLMVSTGEDISVLEQPARAAAEGEQREGEQEETTMTIGGEDYGSFQEWDADGDGMLAPREFSETFAEREVYDDLDADGDGEVGEEDFHAWMWTSLDANDDDEVDERQFTRFTERWSDDLEWGSYGEWDADEDGTLTDSEFQTGISEVGVFDDWDEDGDGVIAQDQFCANLFGLWDTNGDEMLEPDEVGFDVGGEDEEVTRR